MARTAQGASLTEQHRRAQIALRAQMLRDFLRLWPIWDEEDDATFRQLVDAAVPLMVVGYNLSRSLAASYFHAFRFAEEIIDDSPPRLAPALDTRRAVGTLYTVGLEQHRKVLASGKRPDAAREATLVRMSGTLTEQILSGGRETVLASVEADREARGWARVTAANPCAFCALLASRGAVYKGKDTGGFRAHDHCTCTAEPVYGQADLPPHSLRFGELYDQAQREARAAGELNRGTSNDALNAFRRLLSKQ